MLIPFMSLLFIGTSLIAIFTHITEIPHAFALIFQHAFQFKAVGGGITGYAFAQVVRKGMSRGVFSNEAGLGSSPIAHAASETKEPVKQGMWGVFEVFFDTFIICTLTALTFLTTFDIAALTGTEDDTIKAMEMFTVNFGSAGTVIFAIIMPLFAFTTIIAWSFYGEKATGFLFQKLGTKGRRIAITTFKILYVLLIVASAGIHSELVWAISDTANGLMAIPNLIALIAMSGLIARITKNYFDRQNGADIPPMLSADPQLNAEFEEELKPQV